MNAAAAPQLTVVVPTHDVAPWIDECLGSIRGQQGVDLRVVVVDDHSRDGTVAIVERHVLADERVSLVRAEQSGGGPARNRGVAEVTTPFLAFADGDDLVPPDAYRKLVGSLEATGSDLAVGNFFKFAALRTWQPARGWQLFDVARQRTTLQQLPQLIRNRACWNRVFRTEFWRDHGIAFPDASRSNDIVPMTTALVAASAIDVLPDFVYLYRERPGSTSMTAASAELSSLISYLEQEIECAELVRGLGGPAWEDYVRLFLHADGWAHLNRYLLDTVASGRSASPRVAELVQRMLVTVPGGLFDELPARREVVFRLLDTGRVDLAASADGVAERGVQPEELDDTVRFWIDTLELLGESGMPAERRALALVELVLEPLLTVAHHTAPARLEDAIAQLSAFDAVGAADGAGTSDDVRRVAAAVRNGDADRLRAVASRFSETRIELERVTSRGTTIELHGTAWLPNDRGGLQLTAKLLRAPDRLPLGTISTTRRSPDGWEYRWTARVPAGRLSRTGTWQLLVEVDRDEFGAVEVHITAGRRGPLEPEARWAPVVVLPRKQRDDRVTLASRGTLARRVARRLKLAS